MGLIINRHFVKSMEAQRGHSPQWRIKRNNYSWRLN